MQTHTLLTESADLRYRLDSMERQIQELSQRAHVRQYVDDGTRRLETDRRISLHAQEFEKVLQRSWVYRRNAKRDETMSFRSSVVREHAWSEMSKLTLANVSIISVIALPIKLSELVDSSWYRTPDPYLVRSSITVLATPALLGQSPSVPKPRNIEIVRELKVEKGGRPGHTAWRDEHLKSSHSIRVEVLTRPSTATTSNYFKKARLWASRISEAALNGTAPIDRVTSIEPHNLHVDETYLDNDDYATLDVSTRGLYMIHSHDLGSLVYKTQILVTFRDGVQPLLRNFINPSMTRVRILSLQGTGLEIFPTSLLLDLRALISLDISNNLLEEIPDTLSRMSSLEEISIQGNPLKKLPIDVWQMESLEQISIDGPVWRDERQRHLQVLRWQSVESFRAGGGQERDWVILRRREG